MRKMIEETVRLTELNMQDYRADRDEKMRLRREKIELKFKKEVEKQQALRAKNAQLVVTEIEKKGASTKEHR